MAFDSAAFNDAVRANQSAEILLALDQAGVLRCDPRLGEVKFRQPNAKLRYSGISATGVPSYACDAQPELVTTSNSGVPYYLSNILDPRLIEVLVSPMVATSILSETQRGDWTTNTVQFKVIESEGQVSAYGDYSESGTVSANDDFPTRQAFHYQTFTQWGERELANQGLAGVEWAARQNISSALILNKFQNDMYFFGISSLQNYGILNDPGLYAPIAATAAWSTLDALGVYGEFIRMFTQLQSQSNGTVTMETPLTIALSNVLQVQLTKVTSFNVSVADMLKKNFPNHRIVPAVQYSTGSGELVQMIVDRFDDGVETGNCIYTEKMRAHAMVTLSSAWKQKKSQGGFGAVYYRTFGVSQLLGA